MAQEHTAVILDDLRLNLNELAVSCTVTRDWIIEHVEAGVLYAESGAEPEAWLFTSRTLRRARQIHEIERTFDANPELAGLVADLSDELNRLRTRLRREGLLE